MIKALNEILFCKNQKEEKSNLHFYIIHIHTQTFIYIHKHTCLISDDAEKLKMNLSR